MMAMDRRMMKLENNLSPKEGSLNEFVDVSASRYHLILVIPE